MNLTLRDITKDNWEECVNLRVHKNQSKFVATNVFSLVQSHYLDGLYPMGIYDEDYMVGFLMYEHDSEDNMMGMCRLMIDRKHQKKGYGKIAIQILMELIRELKGNIPFYTSVEPENKVAFTLYRNLGFEETGEFIEGEALLKIQL